MTMPLRELKKLHPKICQSDIRRGPRWATQDHTGSLKLHTSTALACSLVGIDLRSRAHGVSGSEALRPPGHSQEHCSPLYFLRLQLTSLMKVLRHSIRYCSMVLGARALSLHAAAIVCSLRCIITVTMCADWDQVLSVVKGTSFATKHAARAMMAAKTAGSIVSIPSTSAFVAQPALVPYSTSKGAILTMTRVSALNLGKAGIR